jgi:hypothetical protein
LGCIVADGLHHLEGLLESASVSPGKPTIRSAEQHVQHRVANLRDQLQIALARSRSSSGWHVVPADWRQWEVFAHTLGTAHGADQPGRRLRGIRRRETNRAMSPTAVRARTARRDRSAAWGRARRRYDRPRASPPAPAASRRTSST